MMDQRGLSGPVKTYAHKHARCQATARICLTICTRAALSQRVATPVKKGEIELSDRRGRGDGDASNGREETWVYSERNAVTHLPVHSLLMEVSCNPKVALGKNQEKKEKVESRKTSVRKNTPFSALRSKIALKTPRLRPLKY
jgi:hypothetical protein